MTMITINKPSADNMGGLLGIWAVPLACITSLYGGTLTLSSTNTVTEIYFTPGTGSYQVEKVPATENRAGSFFRHKVTAFVPRVIAAAEEVLDDLADHKFLVVVKDGNEQYLAIGTTINMLRFSYSQATGADTHEKSGYTLSFDGDTTVPAMIITDPF